MSELGELKQAVLNAQRWANSQVRTLESRRRDAMAGQQGRHRALLRRLVQELEVPIPSQRSNRETIRLQLRDRVAALIENVGTPQWQPKEQERVLNRAMHSERLQVHWAAMDVRSFYVQIYTKTKWLEEAYVSASALKSVWANILSTLSAIEQAKANNAALITDMLSVVTVQQAEQTRLIERFTEARWILHKIEMQEHKERARSGAAQTASTAEAVDVGMQLLLAAMSPDSS